VQADQLIDCIDPVYGFTAGEVQVRAEPVLFEPPSTILTFNRSIEIRNLTYGYETDQDPVLRGLSLSLKKGTITGISGETGAGKSTLVNIILRLIDQHEGEILVDGTPVDANLAAWRAMMGYVEQSPFILRGTIRENVAFGEPLDAVDEQKLFQSIEQAGLNAFVASLPDGVDSAISEDGGNISGGQRQRLAIARALYRDAQVLLLDEATSDLDADSVEDVLDSVQRLQARGLTVILVSPQQQTLRRCDELYELEQGKLVSRTPPTTSSDFSRDSGP
jgi:HlyD family secretion protein